MASFSPTPAGGLLKLARNATICACESAFRVNNGPKSVPALSPLLIRKTDVTETKRTHTLAKTLHLFAGE
jgi:hypothetical protein